MVPVWVRITMLRPWSGVSTGIAAALSNKRWRSTSHDGWSWNQACWSDVTYGILLPNKGFTRSLVHTLIWCEKKYMIYRIKFDLTKYLYWNCTIVENQRTPLLSAAQNIKNCPVQYKILPSNQHNKILHITRMTLHLHRIDSALYKAKKYPVPVFCSVFFIQICGDRSGIMLSRSNWSSPWTARIIWLQKSH